MKKTQVIAIDLEFSIRPRKMKYRSSIWAECIELGAVRLDIHNDIVDAFSTLVKPSLYVSKRTEEFTGILNESLQNAEGFELCFDKFLEWVDYENFEKTIFITWGSADSKVLADEIHSKTRHRIDFLEILKDFYDLQKAFDVFLNTKYPASLSDSLELLDCNFSGKKHQAENDAVALAQVYSAICEQKLFEPLSEPLWIDTEKYIAKQDKNKLNYENSCLLGEFFPKELKVA